MSYNVTIFGNNYELPARTIYVDEQIEEIGKLEEKYSSGVMTRRDVVEKMHGFIESLAPGSVPPIDEADTNDLLKTCIDIIKVYDEPARKVKLEAQLVEIRDLLNTPEIKKALELAKVRK